MSPIAISLIAFACIFSGALLGIFIRKLLPEHHLSADSRDVIKLFPVCWQRWLLLSSVC